ncbi:MAG TPA: helix-turn-helix transcriptional regulator [Thermoanaerobaculia bacterium]
MEPEVQRLINILRTAMRVLGVTNREIERKLGQSPSYLSRVFSGGIELKAEHLILIPKAMGMEPAEFFQLAYPKRVEPSSRAAVQLRESLQDLQIPIEVKQPEISDEQLEKLMVSTLRKLMGKRYGMDEESS